MDRMIRALDKNLREVPKNAPEGVMNVCHDNPLNGCQDRNHNQPHGGVKGKVFEIPKLHRNPSNSCKDISVWTNQ